MVSHDQNPGKRRLEGVFAIVPGWKRMVSSQGCLLFAVIDMWILDVKVKRLGYNDAMFQGDLIGSEDLRMHPFVVEVKVFKVHGRFAHEHVSVVFGQMWIRFGWTGRLVFRPLRD